jgi:hypothetical protein
MSRELYSNLTFERQKNFTTIITGDESWYYWSDIESSMWARSRDDVPTGILQKIDSKSRSSQYFSAPRKLTFLGSLPKGQNMDFYSFCSTALEGVKAGALAGTRKATQGDFRVHMNNCQVHNSKLTKGKLDEIRLIRWDHPPYSPDITPLDF